MGAGGFLKMWMKKGKEPTGRKERKERWVAWALEYGKGTFMDTDPWAMLAKLKEWCCWT